MRIKADRKLKWLYCLALIGSVLPGLLAASGWVGLAMGWIGLVQLPLLLAYGYRIHLVIRHPTTLDAFIPTMWHAALRKLGIGLMLLGTLAAFGMAFSGQLAQFIFGTKGPSGIAAFVVAMWFAMASSAGNVYASLRDKLTAANYALPADFLGYNPSVSFVTRKAKVAETYLAGEILHYLDGPVGAIALALIGQALGGPAGAFIDRSSPLAFDEPEVPDRRLASADFRAANDIEWRIAA